MGLSAATKRADASQSSTVLKRTAMKAMDCYNVKAKQVCKDVDEHNSKAWTEFVETMGDQACSKGKAAKAIKELKSKLKAKPKMFLKWRPNKMTASRLNRWMGFFQCRTNTAGNYLAVDDPRMIASRAKYAETVKSQNIPNCLVLHLGFKI